jgi:hypothetical protein
MKVGLVVVLLLPPRVFAGANLTHQSTPKNVEAPKKYCEFSSDELDVYRSQLSRDSSPKRTMVVMATTVRWIDDINSFNLPLAVQGHAIPPDVRADFTEKNKTGCQIEPFDGVPNLRFMSSSEEEKLFARGWGEFSRKYGKSAERVAVSRVGFSVDKSLALIHILYSASGELYLLERKEGKWKVKFYVQTMAT